MIRATRVFNDNALATVIRQAGARSSQMAAVVMVSALLTVGGNAWAAVDSDGDGLSDIRESQLNTDPTNPDSDSDGLQDGHEVTLGSDPLRVDSDGDGLHDGDEVNLHNTSPTETDTDFDTLTDDQELSLGTDPNVWDSDGGGMADGTEVVTGTNPLDDSDDLQDQDLDNDGLPNDIDGTDDFDGDGLPNQLDLDSDNDGIPDLIEAGGEDVDNDGLFDDPTDANGDGLADAAADSPLAVPDTDEDGAPNFTDLDSDDDGDFDLIEAGGSDADNDGTVDDFADDDADGNGLADSLTGEDNGLPLTDSDGDGVADYLSNDDALDPADPTDPAEPTDGTDDVEIITGLSGHPFGCTLQTGLAHGVDPVLPSILAILAAMGFVRRRSNKA